MKLKTGLCKTPVWVFGFSSVLFVFACSFFWNHIPMSESIYFLKQIQTLKSALTVSWHPPLYTLTIHLFYSLFNGSFIGGYVVGIISVILSGWLIYIIIRFHNNGISNRPLTLWLIFLGYFSLPIITQGSFIFDIDNTILTPVLLATYLAYLYFQRKPNLKTGCYLFLIITISLWCKMTTPMILLCSIGFFHFIKFDFKFLIFRLLPVFIVSLILFYLSYGQLYTDYVLNGYGSFQFSGGKSWGLLAGKNTFQLPTKQFIFSVGSNVGALIVWTSPLLLLLLAGLLWPKRWDINLFKTIVKTTEYPQRFIVPIIFIAATVFGYTFLLKIQASAGFPKYHYPIFAFLFVILGHRLSESQLRIQRFDVFYLLITFLFCLFFIKDILYPFYILGRTRQILDLALYFGKTTGLMLFPIVVYLFLRKKHLFAKRSNVLAIGLVFLITANSAGLISRSQADYSTNYHYGVKGTQEVLEYAKEIPIEQSVLLPFTGFLIPPHPAYSKSEYGRLIGTDPYKPETDILIITDYLLEGNKYFFGFDYVNKKYNRVKTIKSYGVWEKK